MDTTDTTASLPGTTPSVGELSAEFARQKRVKSPPLAFEKTSNDSLAPLTSPTRSRLGQLDNIARSPTMGRLSPLQEGEGQDLQVVIDQQASAIQLLHDAFAAERQAWSLERERLHYRIANLEKLLRTGDGYSPAKSPVLSPFSAANMTSPSSKPVTSSSRLPSIAEYENTVPLSQRRDGAPQSIDISGLINQPNQEQPRRSSVAFESAANELIVEDIPTSPSENRRTLSPPPFNYRMEAGHTPLRAPRPPTPPPKAGLSMDGIEDTATRNNTHINNYLTRSNDEEEDRELKGPLNMPELPHVPGDTNFTFDMLSKRLEQIEKSPDTETAKPMVFAQPSPGLASPTEEKKFDEFSPNTMETEAPNTAPPTRITQSELSSNALSPTTSATHPLSQVTSREDKVQADFENGGIKLKKKPSTNFGAPFGSLGGFGGRKFSQNES